MSFYQNLAHFLLVICTHSLGIHAQASTFNLFSAPNGFPSSSDIQHVSTPNAWLEVTLAGLAYNNSGLVKNALRDLGNGSVAVIMYDTTNGSQFNRTVQKRFWQSETVAGGAVWVAAWQDAMRDVFPYQNDPAWSLFCSLQASIIITGGTPNVASCTSSSVFDPPPHLSITITSRDIEGNENDTNNTMVVFGLGGGVSGITGSADVQYMGFNNSAQKMVKVATVENTWLTQCNWFQFC
jgi:hypothetical protein